jgi:hypothetical protein
MHIFLNSTGLQLFTLIGGTIIPLLIDLITKSTAPAQVKALLNLIATFGGALVAALIAAPSDVGFDLNAWLWTAVPTFIVSVAALFGLHMPTQMHDKAKTAITG